MWNECFFLIEYDYEELVLVNDRYFSFFNSDDRDVEHFPREQTNANVQKLKKDQRELTRIKKNNYNTFKAKSQKSEIWLKIDKHNKHGRL